MNSDHTRHPTLGAVSALLGVSTSICLAVAAIFLVFVGFLVSQVAGYFLPANTTWKSVGPTVSQLQQMQFLVSSRVTVSDVLEGESTYLKGVWIIRGDAVIGVDMSTAEVVNRDERTRTATISLPQPTVLTSRVDLEKTREWDMRSKSWIPFATVIWGDKEGMRETAMKEAQKHVENASNHPIHKSDLKRHTELAVEKFYVPMNWNVKVQWRD